MCCKMYFNCRNCELNTSPQGGSNAVYKLLLNNQGRRKLARSLNCACVTEFPREAGSMAEKAQVELDRAQVQKINTFRIKSRIFF